MSYNLKPSYSGVDELTTRDRGVSIIYGRKPDALGGEIVPIGVDTDGNLTIGTVLNLDTSDINIGDVVVRGIYDPSVVGPNPEVGEARIGLKLLSDLSPINTGLYAVLVDGSGVTQPVNLVSCGGTSITTGQKTSALSIPVVLPSDQSISVGTLNVETINVDLQAIVVTGTITSLNGTVQIEMQGRSGLAFQLAGTWTSTVVAETSTDNAATWNQVSIISTVLGGSAISAVQVQGNGNYRISILDGVTHARVRAADTVTGTISITLTATAAPSHVNFTITSLDPQSPTVAGFGRLRTSAPYRLFDSQFTTDGLPLLWDTYTINGGTCTLLTNEAAMLHTVGTASGSSAIMQSHRYFHYQAGRSQIILSTAVLGVPTTNAIVRVGYFDVDNGAFFQLSSTGLAAVLRSSTSGSPIDTIVPQGSWNIDNFDGTGPSGIKIDTTKANIYLIELEWLGTGLVRMGFSVNGAFYLCHEFRNSNALTSVYMATASLPSRFELSTTGITSGTVSTKHICTSISSESGQEPTNYVFSANSDAIGNDVSAAGTAIFLLRPALTFNGLTNRGTILPSKIEIFPISGQSIYWSVIQNPTITGSPVWTSVNSNSIAQYSTTTGISISGGYTIDSGFAVAGSVKMIEYPNGGAKNKVELSLDMTGTIQDVVAIVAGPVSDVVPVGTSMTWKEYR